MAGTFFDCEEVRAVLYRTDMNTYSRICRVALTTCGLLIALSPASVQADRANMRRDGALTLNLGSGDTKGFYAACIDPSNGFAYFAAIYVYKVDIRGALPQQVGSGLNLQRLSAFGAMDAAAGCAYFASGPNIFQILANGTNPTFATGGDF